MRSYGRRYLTSLICEMNAPAVTIPRNHNPRRQHFSELLQRHKSYPRGASKGCSQGGSISAGIGRSQLVRQVVVQSCPPIGNILHWLRSSLLPNRLQPKPIRAWNF